MNKIKFPFRLGSTSYIIPADILTNANYVKATVDDVELILFETPGESNLPSPLALDELKKITSEHDVTFTVHLPTDRKPCIADDYREHPFVLSVCKTIELCKPLTPYAYVLHLEGIKADCTKKELAEWKEVCRAILDSILTKSSIPAEMMCIENLSYPWVWFKSIAEEFGCSYCLDIGHLWATNAHDWDVQALLMLDNARVIHLHGLCATGDHCSLVKSDSERTEKFISMIRSSGYRHVVTLEVFDETDFKESVECVKELWEK